MENLFLYAFDAKPFLKKRFCTPKNLYLFFGEISWFFLFKKRTQSNKTILQSKFRRSKERKKIAKEFTLVNDWAIYRTLTKLQPNLQSSSAK